MPEKKTNIGLFVTCLVDLFRPTVGFAAVKLLEAAGCRVHVPDNQTCCGQPAYNNGDIKTARRMALRVMDAFGDYDYTVLPSGSCAAMMKVHYPALFENDPARAAQARKFSDTVFELVSFLSHVRGVEKGFGSYTGSVTYHDSCTGLRQLGIKKQPRRLLESIPGLHIQEMTKSEACCGFGGTFSAEFPEISARMARAKVDDIRNSGADTVLAGDLGCVLKIAAALKSAGMAAQARHVAEFLAGLLKEGKTYA